MRRNRDWRAEAAAAPDGDADIDAAASNRSRARCARAAGMVKPDVVFFGENVPGDRDERAREALPRDALLVAGSSLMVFSGYRFVRLAHEAGLPIAIVNRGRTRGDDLARSRSKATSDQRWQALSQHSPDRGEATRSNTTCCDTSAARTGCPTGGSTQR